MIFGDVEESIVDRMGIAVFGDETPYALLLLTARSTSYAVNVLTEFKRLVAHEVTKNSLATTSLIST